MLIGGSVSLYCLSDIVHDNCTVGIPVVHRSQRLIAFLSGCIPYLELHRGSVVEGYRLCKECGADCRFSIVIELILYTNDQYQQEAARFLLLKETVPTLTNLKTKELWGEVNWQGQRDQNSWT